MILFNEGLKAGDLEGVVSPSFSIDQYKSKMGEDRHIMVLAFTVDGQAPAKDLESFAETGFKSVLDADATPGTMEDGKHKVFIEFARTPEVAKQIMAFVEDLKKLTNIEEFSYTYHKGTNSTNLDAGLGEGVPTTPEAYDQTVNEMKVSEAKNCFDKYQMLECSIKEKTINFKKHGSHETIQFEMHKIGATNEIIKEAKAFAIDINSIAECTHLTKYFGPYNITKTTENKFIFSKDGQSALLSKSGW